MSYPKRGRAIAVPTYDRFDTALAAKAVGSGRVSPTRVIQSIAPDGIRSPLLVRSEPVMQNRMALEVFASDFVIPSASRAARLQLRPSRWLDQLPPCFLRETTFATCWVSRSASRGQDRESANRTVSFPKVNS